MTQRIGIIGASGFVGSALCERLFFSGNRNFIPFVHSSGNAWRIARLPVPIRSVDLLDRQQVWAAVSSCDVVVNCSLASNDRKSRGLRNLADAAKKARIKRFVHLSSVAIYGRDPPRSSATEAGKPDPGGNPYGILKLRQDEIVFELHRAGVPSFILCPGNIGGPYSLFMRGLAERLARGPLPLVDGGSYPSNVIHIDNLIEAILAAIRSERGAGERYFVNESQPVPWRRIFDDLGRLLGLRVSYVDIARKDVLPFLSSVTPRVGLAGHLRIAISGEFRSAISAMPMFRGLNDVAGLLFSKLPRRYQLGIRERLTWPMRVSKRTSGPSLDDRYVTVQARRFYHSAQKLRETLNWQPALSYEEGLETTVAWLRFARVVPGSTER
jgi:nucleoside-diphosphate-sugar epimerase